MIKNIDQYLAQLHDELEGVDQAIIQDALADSEDHLRAALVYLQQSEPDLSGEQAMARVIDEYGIPAEVADGYRQVEALTRVPLAPQMSGKETPSLINRFFGAFVDPRAYASFFYMCFSLITGIVYFTWAVTGVSLAAGLSVLIIGLPFIVTFMLSIRGIALVEGRIIEALLGVRMPSRPLFSQNHLGLWDRLKALFSDSRAWATLLYMILQLPLGTLYFTLCITLFSVGISFITAPFLQLFRDEPVIRFFEHEVWMPFWAFPVTIIVGAFVVLMTLHLAKAIGQWHARYAKALLVR